MKEVIWLQNGVEIPTVKPLYARRLSDNKELFAVSAYNEGINVIEDGKKIQLKFDECTLIRK